MSAEARKKAEGELKKLKLMSPMSAEASVVRNYLDVLIGLPWGKKTKLKHDLANAEDVLNQDHFGLDKVKDRILEYLAVQQRVDKVKAPILVLGGASRCGQDLAGSVDRQGHWAANTCAWPWAACATRPKFVGHRRTYIGALPGKVLQNLNKVGTKNPLVLAGRDRQAGHRFPWVTHPALCWRCWTPSKTTRSVTITWRSTLT
jgi:ATP-dependent Lon protease